MSSGELDDVKLLCAIFRWPEDDQHAQFAALIMLRRAREETKPTWDDFLAGRDR